MDGGPFLNWDRLIAITAVLLDAGILWILIEEFNFDKIAYEKEQYKKRKHKRMEFESLTTGEGK
jgi:hypothetical protein